MEGGSAVEVSAGRMSAAELPGAWFAAAWLKRLASLKVTLTIFALLGASVIYGYSTHGSSEWFLAAPLLAGGLNLAAAVLTNPVFRRQTALLTFHLALLALVILAAAGRLTYLTGQLELAEGEVFAGQLAQSESGPWHRLQLERAQFVNDGFTIRYEKGVRRAETRNAIRWMDDAGNEQYAVIGDNEPLVRHGYRFYTSFNKGFAPVFLWYPADGSTPRRGTIHLPSYPIHEYRQALDWTLPGTQLALWTMLQFDEVLLDPEQVSRFRLPERHTLVVRVGDIRQELVPGARMSLPQGVLVYERLSTWMGYTVFYDWTLPWLFVACMLAVASLAWHFWKKCAAQPWDQ
ncbi:MAG: cytochrome c biogenesis protein ResB [Burkholderiales bacterium]|nr:cytochrome c biogenesis protein ResB [Burkholderiales bacterium]